MSATLHPDCAPERLARYQELVTWWESEAPAITVHTSGSTGNPKAIEIQRSAIRASIRATHDALSSHFTGNHARMLVALPLDTIGGIMAVFRALAWQWSIDLLPNTREVRWSGSASMISLVPQQALALEPELWSQIDVVLLGGGPLSRPGRQQLLPYADRIWEGFGMTETVSHIALKRLDATHYQSVQGVELHQNTDHALVIHAPSLGVSHMTTHDVVELEGDGFKWLGRKDLAIISAGKKIHPEMVEDALGQAGAPFGIVTWVPHEDWGQSAIWMTPHHADDDIVAYEKALATLPSWQRPKACVHAELPLTRNGKLDRAAAQRLAQELALA